MNSPNWDIQCFESLEPHNSLKTCLFQHATQSTYSLHYLIFVTSSKSSLDLDSRGHLILQIAFQTPWTLLESQLPKWEFIFGMRGMLPLTPKNSNPLHVGVCFIYVVSQLCSQTHLSYCCNLNCMFRVVTQGVDYCVIRTNIESKLGVNNLIIWTNILHPLSHNILFSLF